ncbi:MAG: sulfatase, partial [Lentisphaerae bacterium]
MNKPNILFAFGDDYGRYASAYAKIAGTSPLNTLIQTPNIDRIAREGALFTNAIVPAPSCTPCRSSVLTGRYFWQTNRGAILQGAVWDDSIPSYPLMLEEAGYHIGYTYKVWAPGTPVNQPYGGQRTRYEPAGSKFGNFSQNVTREIPRLGVDGARQLLLDEVRQNFDAFLDARPDNRPFCYWWGP